MNISNWPVSRILQLPDCCFGQRYVVSVSGDRKAFGDWFSMSEIAFPSQCVIWEYSVYFAGQHVDGAYWRLALGLEEPADTAEFSLLEPLIPGFGLPGVDPKQMWQGYGQNFAMRGLRLYRETQGRRLVLQCHGAAGATTYVFVAVVVSSLPKEVPEWAVRAR